MLYWIYGHKNPVCNKNPTTLLREPIFALLTIHYNTTYDGIRQNVFYDYDSNNL